MRSRSACSSARSASVTGERAGLVSTWRSAAPKRASESSSAMSARTAANSRSEDTKVQFDDRRGSALIARVLRLRLLVPDLGDSVVGGHRGLGKRDRDQRDLSFVACDVAGGIDSGLGGAHRGGVDQELATIEVLQPPVRDRAE